MKRLAAAIFAILTTAVICYGVESLSIQQMFQSSPKETAPQGATRVLTVRGGVVRQMSYSSVHPLATSSTPGAVKPDGTTTTVDVDGTFHGIAYPNPGIPYSLGNGWGIPFTPSNKIPSNYVALPVVPATKAPCGNGYHLDSYDATTGQFTCSADASVGGASDPNAIHVNAAGEIAGVSAKATPAGADLILIESAADGNVKRSIRADALPYQPQGSYLQSSAVGSTVQAHSAALDAVTGTNTGDETQASIKSKLGAAGPGDGYMTAAQYVTLSNALQPGASTTGNAGTATKLATPRAINGVAFDGSAPITINAVDSTPRLAATAQAVDSAKLAGATPSANALTLITHSFSQMVSDLSTALNAAYHGLTILGSEVTTALGYTPENVANKSTSIATDGTSDTKYPSAKAVKTYVDASVVAGGVSSSVFAAYTSIDRLTADNPTYTGTLTSNSADGTHFVQPYNSVAFSGTPSEGMLQTTAAGLLQQYHSGAWQTVTGSGSGTVTSITASSPLTGGTITGSGTIGIPAATTSTSGYLTSTDWNTFNGKQSALVSGTSIKTVAGISLLGSGDIGTIPTSKGGTGATDFSFSGTQHKVASVSGVFTTGNQVTTDANGNFVTSAYAVGSTGGGGSGTVGNSSNAYRLAGYAAAGTTVSDSGITYATDGSTISTTQPATAADALGLRAQASYGTNAVNVTVANSAITPWSFTLPAAQPTDGLMTMTGGVIGTTPVYSYTLPDASASTKGGVTISGTTTQAASVSGTKTTGKQLQFDASGNVVASSYDVGATGGSSFTGGTLTSKLTLMTGSNSSAPINIPAQVNPAGPLTGDLWFNSTYNQLYLGVGGNNSYSIPLSTANGSSGRIATYTGTGSQIQDSGIDSSSLVTSGSAFRNGFSSGATSGNTLTMAQVSSGVITNYGQGNSATTTLYFPSVSSMTSGGYSVVFVVDTLTSGSTWSINRYSGDLITDICLNGTCGKTSISESNQPVGSRLACFNSQTGSGQYARWNCQSISGTWN